MYSHWNEKFQKLFAPGPRKDNGPVANLSDPLRILDYIEKEIFINSNDKL